MMVKQWNNRIKNINSYLPWMKPNVRAFTEEDLINKVITPNIPSVWEKDFRLANSHLKQRIKDIIEPLTIIEEQVKPANSMQNPSKKTLKTLAGFIMEDMSGMIVARIPRTLKAMGKTK